MRRECTMSTVAGVILVGALLMFLALVINDEDISLTTEKRVDSVDIHSISTREEDPQDNTICHGSVCAQAPKQGLDIIYYPLISCAKPEFLKNYTNPCWRSQNKMRTIACAAKVMLLGFPQCGGTDIERWFDQHSQVISTTADYFYETGLFQGCPNKWLQKYPRGKRYLTYPTMTGFDSCSGCTLASRAMNTTSTYMVRQSAVQYLQYTMVPSSRYIISMRQPSQRMISNFFQTYDLQGVNEPYIGYDIKHVGNTFFHNIVSEAVSSLTACLEEHGSTVCILHPELLPTKSAQSYIIHMITIGCYSTHLKEVLKFIPREIIYFTKLEEYAQDDGVKMKKIYEFLGLSSSGVDDPIKNKLNVNTSNLEIKAIPVLAITTELLNKFYESFNIELAEMLEDDKWLWR